MDFREQFEIQKEKDTAKEGSYISFEEQFRQNKAVRDSSGITELLKANIKDPGEAAAVAGMTYTLADHFKQDPVTILKDLPGWAAKYNGIVKDNKGAWQQIWDAAKTGWATDRLGRIGSALMVDRTPEDKQRLFDEAASIRAGIPGTEGDSQSLGMKIATSSANLLGTMVRPLVTNLLVSALIPEAKIGAVMGDIAKGIPAIAGRAEKVAAIAARATGHGAPFLVTWADTAQVESGNIYLDMLDAGVDEDIARKYAGVHGAIAGALEAAPLEFAFTRMPVYRKAAQTAFSRLCGRAVSKAGVAKTMSSALSNAFINIASSTLFETVTEVAQEGSAVYFEKKAALALPDEIKDEKLRKMLPEAYGQWRAYYEQEVEGRKDYYESQEYKDYVADRVWDVLVQTALGTAPLSFLGASGQAISDVKYTQSIKKEAEVNPSKLNFIKRHFNDRQFDEIPKEKRAETLAQIYEDYHSGERVDAVDGSTLDTDYIKINESEEMPEGEEQASEAPAEPPKRRKDNRLHIQEAIRPENTVHHDDGSVSKTILLGTTDNNKRYGQINFTVKDNDITIDSVKMRAGQQALTEEFITDFMQRYKGYNISWEPASEAQKKIRENLLNVNKGTKYEGQLQQFWGKGDREQINKTARLIQDKFKNFTPDQAMVGAELLDLLAQKRGKTLSQLVSDDMGKGDIRLGTVREGIEAGVLDADEVKNKRGAIQWAAEAGKAFIWVGEKGDFSTLGHEVTHFVLMTDPEAAKELAAQLKDAADTPQFRQYLDEHMKIMEGVTESKNDIVSSLTTEQILDQIKSLPDDVEKWTTTQHEIAAVLAETYLQEGETFNPELKSLFDKIIDWFLKIYGMLKRKAHLNEGIIKAYDNLFTKNPELKEKYEAQQQAEAAQQGAREQGKTMFQGATPEELAEAEKQYAETEAKYKNTDQWLKAPNGQPTKLTERQWVQVRTPNFIRWFGDWLNDPDNASKVVDENGEPLVVGHETDAEFDTFDASLTKYEAFFFSSKPSRQGFAYGENRMGLFLNIRNPYIPQNEHFPGGSELTDGARYYNENEGTNYDGSIWIDKETGRENNVYVAFSPEQIKSATDNVGTFSQSNPSILFQTDTEYLEAVNSGDMAKAQAMVDARAREMGYNSPKLYHGTKQFGFTTVDVSKSDDQVSFFATDRLETAETYSGEETATSIGKRKQISEIKEEINQNADKMLDLLKKIAPKKFGRFTISDIANEIISNIEWENFNSIGFDPFFGLSKLYELFNMAVSDNENLSKLSVGDLDQTQEYKTYSKIFDDIAKVLTESAGNYSLYAKTDKFLKIDAKGANWNKIILPKNIQNRLKKYQVPNWEYYQKGVYKVQVNTRELSYFARQLGYRGVEIKNVVDNGGRGNKYNGYLQLPPATVYIFFDPQSQVKSADPVTYDDNGNVIPLSERFNPQHTHQNLLFQSAYHGSGASFDKFDTDFMGTGEGAQAFGWGIYLTQSEGIARSYAEQNKRILEGNIRITRNGEAISKEEFDLLYYLGITGKSRNEIEDAIYQAKEDAYMEADEADREVKKWQAVLDILDNLKGLDALKAFEDKPDAVKEKVKSVLGKDYDWFSYKFKDDGADRLPQEIRDYYLDGWQRKRDEAFKTAEGLEDFDTNGIEIEETGGRNLYTASIPDDTGNNYLYWDKKYGKRKLTKIFDELVKQKNLDRRTAKVEGKGNINQFLSSTHIDKYKPTGEELYHYIEGILHSDKEASEFLSRAGFVGIDYPANSMSGGNRYGKRNFVIFNADDITIDKHTMWQNELQQDLEADLMKQAKGLSLDEWIDFNKFLGDENLTDDQLKAIWERANSATKTAEGATVISAGAMTEDEKDTAFYNLMQTDDGIRNFIRALRFMYNFMNEIDQQGVGQEDIEYLDKVQETLNLANSAAPKITMIAQGKTPIEDIKPETIKNIRGMIVNNLTDYRDLYARAAGSEDLAVSGEALPLIQEPTAETQRMSFAERKAYADRIEAQELKKKILKGKETYEGEAQKVVKYLDSEIKKGEVKIKELQEDIGHKREALSMKDKKLLKDAEEKKEVEKKLNRLNATIRSKLDKGVRISTEEYKRRDSLMERLDVLKEATAQLVNQTKVKALADKQDALQKLKDKYKKDMEQRRLAREIIAYKKKLWNGIMRKVSRNVNWEQAEVINAIHRLLGGVSESTNENITLGGKSMTLKEFREGIDKGTIEVAGLSDYQLKRYLNKTLADFTIQELEELYDTVRYLTKTGRQEWQAKVDQRNYEAQQYRNILINEIISSPKFKGNEPLPETTEAIKKSRDLMTMFKTAWYKTLNMERKAQILDNGRKAMAYRLLISEKRDVQDAEYRAIRKRIKKIDALMEKLRVKPEDFYEQFTLDIKGLQDSTYTLAQLIYGVKAQLEERNRQAFAYGNLVNQIEKSNYTDEQIEEIGDRRYQQFTEQAQKILDGRQNVMKIAEAIWEDWQDRDNFDRLNRAAIEEYNQPVNPVQFYMPIARKDFNGTELSQKIANDIYNMNAGKGMTSVEKGMIKDRITISARNQQPVDADYFKLWSDSVAEQEHFIATNAYVRKLNRIFKAHGSKDLQAYIQSVYGNGMLTDINNFINEVANPEVSNDTQGINRYLSILRGALYPAYLAFKASSVILQMITSPAPFLREVGPLELAKGLIQMSMHPVETWRYVTGLSSFMENRSMNPFVEEIKKHSKDYTKSKAGKAWDKFREVGTAGLEMADKWAVTAGWLAVYDKKHDEFIESGMTEEEAQVKAVKYADDVVYETQPLGDKTELAPLFKGGSPAWQAFTQFQVSLNVIWNNLTYDVAVGDINGHEYRKMMGTLIGYALAGAILYSVQEGWGTEDDDTAEEKLLKMLRAIAYGSTTQFTSAVPLLSNNADAIVKKMITGEKWQYRTNQLYPGFDELTMGIATTDWKKILSGAAKLGGVPVSGSKEFWHAIHGREAGDWRLKPGAFLGRRDKKK